MIQIRNSLPRITPACAGKTTLFQNRRYSSRDHPRMCGKDDNNCVSVSGILGSPPHVRERPLGQCILMMAVRITPACAGKTGFHSFNASSARDHPRMCGKDANSYSVWQPRLGSPPHVRERPGDALRRHVEVGITPACAGKTQTGKVYGYSIRDHPRMCGKDGRKSALCRHRLGSPPHVRERLSCLCGR